MNITAPINRILSGMSDGRQSLLSSSVASTSGSVLIATLFGILLLVNSKSGKTFLWSLLFAVDRLLGGAPRSVSLPGPPGFPLVGNLYQVGSQMLLMCTTLSSKICS